jgi:4-diphosphocytidyl-2-C-methyl-D-erythritol kinase
VRIHIRKRIPVGAGLGGGSTDAAATLIGLNRMLRLRFSQTTLEKMALSLGADVPFFIRARPARARGIGERLYPLRRVPRFWLVIVYPGFPVSTAWAFGKLPSTLTKAPVNTSIPSSLKSFDRLANLLVNDLEIVTLKRYPKIRLLKERLLHQGAAGGLMSGSGSSVFGIFGSRRQAAKAWRRLRQEEGADAFLVHVLS